MAKRRERTSANVTAYAEKHRILQALEEFAKPENWAQFKRTRKAYKKFRNGGRGERYDRKKLLDDCEESGLIEQDERALIKRTWDGAVEPILAGMEDALRSVRKGDELNCWIVYGGSSGEDRVIHQKSGDVVDIVILTRDKPPDKVGPYKGMIGADLGFLSRLKAHHREIGALIGRPPRR